MKGSLTYCKELVLLAARCSLLAAPAAVPLLPVVTTVQQGPGQLRPRPSEAPQGGRDRLVPVSSAGAADGRDNGRGHGAGAPGREPGRRLQEHLVRPHLLRPVPVSLLHIVLVQEGRRFNLGIFLFFRYPNDSNIARANFFFETSGARII